MVNWGSKIITPYILFFDGGYIMKFRKPLSFGSVPKGGPQIKKYYQYKKIRKSFEIVRKRFLRKYIEFPQMPRVYYRRDGNAGLKLNYHL